MTDLLAKTPAPERRQIGNKLTAPERKTLAAAEAPALRTWSPEEIEQAREEWLAHCGAAKKVKLRPGPLLDQTRGGLAEVMAPFEAINGEIKAMLTASGEEAA